MALAVQSPTPRIVLADNDLIVDLAALQGLWTLEQYLRLTNIHKQPIEFTDGRLEFLPMPTRRHQAILGFLYRLLFAWLEARGGTVFFMGLRVQIRPGKIREPDLVVLLDAGDPRGEDAFFLGADLVMEIVSPDKPARDLVEKVADYAEARIPEYWIVNPLDATITVLRLAGAGYEAHGVFGRDATATSALLPGFAVPVAAVLDAH